MTRGEAINWIINLTADIGKVEHQDLWHYEQALEEIRDMIEAMPSAQRKLDEWCKDCSEYDHERHCCPRFNRVIRTAIDDAQPEIVRCKECKYYQTDKCYVHIERIWELKPDDYCSQGERRGA